MIKKIVTIEKIEIFTTLIISVAFLVGYHFFKFKLDTFSTLNNELRQMVSIFTGMLGTMVGLVFASNMGVVLKIMNSKVGMWPIKFRIRSAFISALLFLIFSLMFETLNLISKEFTNIYSVSLLLILFVYFMTSISHTVEVFIKSTFAGLDYQLARKRSPDS